MTEGTTMRVQMEISSDKQEEIERLMARCEIATKKELINNALTLFKWAVDKIGEGKVVAAIIEGEEIYQELQMPPLSRVREKIR
jgi:hypothetical protein